jgi:hypothetical protein
MCNALVIFFTLLSNADDKDVLWMLIDAVFKEREIKQRGARGEACRRS